MRTSEQIDHVVKALSMAQGAMREAKKDSENPHFRSKYADLASVWEACREQLAKNALAVIQSAGTTEDGRLRVSTMLAHASGQWMADDLVVPVKGDGPQALGAAITYGRRYSLAAMVGVSPADDDAEAAEPRSHRVELSKPDSYELWLTQAQLEVQREGLPGLQAWFKRSPVEMRRYATEVDTERWNKVKALAKTEGGE